MHDYDGAVQTVVFQDPDLDGLLNALAETPIDTVDLWGAHLSPADVVPALGERIDAVHLKVTAEEEIEDAPGAGVLDLAAFITVLDEHATLTEPLVVEYELAENVTGELVAADERIRDAMA